MEIFPCNKTFFQDSLLVGVLFKSVFISVMIINIVVLFQPVLFGHKARIFGFGLVLCGLVNFTALLFCLILEKALPFNLYF